MISYINVYKSRIRPLNVIENFTLKPKENIEYSTMYIKPVGTVLLSFLVETGPQRMINFVIEYINI